MQTPTMEDDYIPLENLRISDSLEAALDTNSHQTNPDTYQKLLGINQSSVKTQSLIQLWNVARTTKQFVLIDAIHDLRRTEISCLPGTDPTTKEGGALMKQIMDSRSPARREDDVKPVTILSLIHI